MRQLREQAIGHRFPSDPEPLRSLSSRHVERAEREIDEWEEAGDH